MTHEKEEKDEAVDGGDGDDGRYTGVDKLDDDSGNNWW